VVRWPELRDRDTFRSEDELARGIAQAMSGVLVKDPLTSKLLLRNRITVHPLGGCAMATDAATGVVDHAGRVFGDDGTTLAGLYVADASVIPTSLGINPLWTITAVAERIADHVAIDLGLAPKSSSRLPYL
jgi:cholesterol oxidase